MAKIVFYCHDTKSNIQSFEYYKQDIDALQALGHDVVVCNRYTEIPFKFDLIFIWWWTHALAPVLLARMLNRPSIVTGPFNFKFPAGLSGDYFSRPSWQRLLLKVAARWCTRNLFINTQELADCSAYFGLSNGRPFTHVLDADYLRGPSAERQLTLFNLAWSGKQNLIRKGIPDLLAAMAILKSQNTHVALKLAGLEGDGVQFLRDLITGHGLQDNVEWLGPLSRERKIELLRSCEIYVQPSRYEGFGLATAEAMGSGACIITCDVGAVRSVVGECGLYVTPGSAEELAAAIKTAVEDGATRRRLQACGYQRAVSELNFDSKLQRLKGYLAEIGIA